MQRIVMAAVAAALAVAGGCGDAALEPARLEIRVAPLQLDGVTNATYALTVVNGAGQTVWTRTVDSDAYGDGAGALSYVGPCDADSNPNRVELVVVGVDAGATALTEGVDWMNPAPAGDPLSLDAICAANEDTRVAFDVTLARAARQGFFDVAVSFQDVFCSAKLDCKKEVDAALLDLELLANPVSGDRDLTAVLGFACTAGPGQSTVLHMSEVDVTCDTGGYSAVVDPAAGPGNLDPSFAGPLPNTSELLFQAATYRGVELLGDNHKAYWNVALGLNRAAFALGGECRLTADATVTDGLLPGGATPAGTRWPYVSWDVQLFDGGALTCERHEVGGGDGVEVRYSATSGLSYASSYQWSGAPGVVTNCTAPDQALTYTGGVVNVTVPEGCAVLDAELWGGGGGGSGSVLTGGAGGYGAGRITVTAGATLAVVVAGGGGDPMVIGGPGGAGGFGGGGKGGTGGTHRQGSGGGGYSGIFAGSVSHANALLMAGGGGGSAASPGAGGAGGGLAGSAATQFPNGDGAPQCYATVGSGGGTQSAGGARKAPISGNGNWTWGGNGGPLAGGNGGPDYESWGGGGGGGGYYGGAGGDGDYGWNFCNYGQNGAGGSSGGGGSGFAHPTLVSDAVLTAGSGAVPPNTGDADYVAGVATGGGLGGVFDGGPGLVILRWE